MSRTIKQSTAALPPSQRFDFWNDTILVGVDMVLRTERQAFACERLVTPGVQSSVVDTRSTAFAYTRSGRHVAQDGKESVALCSLTEGFGMQSQGGREITFAPGDFFITDMGRPQEIATGDVYRETRIYVDRALFESRVGKASALGGLRLAADTPLIKPFTAYLAAYVAAVPSMRPEDAEAGLEGVLHLLAGLVRTTRSVRIERGETLGLTAIREMADDYIGRRLTSPTLNVAAMVRDLGIARTRLYAAFAETGGVGAAILDARLERARARLAVRGGTIEDIAMAAGFNDYATFFRAFRRRFDCSPREYREGSLPL